MTEYQTGLRRMPPGFDLDGHLARLDADGFTIVKDYLGEDQLARFREGLKPYLNAYRGRNSFEGLATERVYTLVGRGRIYEEIACDHRLLAILDRLLAPNYLLSADHAICIYPGEKAQALHFDDGFYPFPRPRPAMSISVIGAIDAFTPENGGTVLYRGSHKWPSERIQAVREAVARGEIGAAAEHRMQLAMPSGALCVRTLGPAAGEFLPGRAKGKGEKNEPRDANPAGVRAAPASQHHGPGQRLSPDQNARSGLRAAHPALGARFRQEAPMLTFFGDLDSGNVYKVRLLLAQLGTAYRRVDDHPKLGAAGELRFMWTKMLRGLDRRLRSAGYDTVVAHGGLPDLIVRGQRLQQRLRCRRESGSLYRVPMGSCRARPDTPAENTAILLRSLGGTDGSNPPPSSSESAANSVRNCEHS
jgi:Phytanoyl-CoA dioxygenase (PhyH)